MMNQTAPLQQVLPPQREVKEITKIIVLDDLKE